MAEKTEVKVPQHEAFLEEKAFRSRTVLLFGEINDTLAYSIVKQLVALADESTDPINLLVCSPGGHVESGDVIHDVIRFIKAPVNMIGSGWVGSAAVNVFLSVPKERRFCLTNTRFLIHQPSGGVGGKASDIEIQAREIIRIRERIAELIAKETGQPLERVRNDIDRDFWMPAKEAIDYGLVSKSIVRQDELNLQ
ncbi:ATP-dependent Clp protease proteolytic subunit [Candidatus Pantoea multigeneris]|uniref:ATP-dependent Clp protease proteolytic subunit n=1 Tax=Candidatus Pantoea multigeneris TaxID=2608357 RepID=A0ABX0R9H3_9GAMM|nr:ATP-dependent Clp protease proteolytic subunit [Pantoea multigeneris]NIF21981.1 ATP-dependent Clp protease proteolytic subunit [Pantoea multigeneris]